MMARSIVARGTMKEEHKTIIQIYAVDIESELEPKHVTGYLFSKFILTHDDRRCIDSEPTPRDRAKLLISKLVISSSRTAFDDFVNSLLREGYVELASKLRPGNDTQAYVQATIMRKRVDDVEGRLKSLEDGLQNKVSYVKDRVDDVVEIQEDVKSEVQSLVRNQKNVVSDVKDLRKNVGEIRKDLEVLVQLTESKDRLEEAIKEKDNKLRNAYKKIEDLEGKLKTLETENSALRDDIDNLSKELTRQEKMLGDRMTSMKKDHDKDMAKMTKDHDKMTARNRRLEGEVDNMKEKHMMHTQEMKEMKKEIDRLANAQATTQSQNENIQRIRGQTKKFEPRHRFKKFSR